MIPHSFCLILIENWKLVDSKNVISAKKVVCLNLCKTVSAYKEHPKVFDTIALFLISKNLYPNITWFRWFFSVGHVIGNYCQRSPKQDGGLVQSHLWQVLGWQAFGLHHWYCLHIKTDRSDILGISCYFNQLYKTLRIFWWILWRRCSRGP